jgi:hypothetical protein
MRLRMPRICRHGMSGWFVTKSGCSLITRGDFTDRDQVQYNRLLCPTINEEVSLAHRSHVLAREPCGLKHVVEGSPEASDRQPSYRLGFPKDSFAHSRRQVIGRKQINPYAQRIFEVWLQSSQVKQCSPWAGVNQQIQVAALAIMAANSRAEHARVAERAARDDPPNGFAVLSEDF